jgi:hypothetical protein
MATQLAATPPIVGKQAKEFLKQIKETPSPKSREGEAKLKKIFAGKSR